MTAGTAKARRDVVFKGASRPSFGRLADASVGPTGTEQHAGRDGHGASSGLRATATMPGGPGAAAAHLGV
eukprot:15148227-Alexandrium_andersonii.AAC.1